MANRGADTPDALARFHAELDLVDLIARQISKSLGRGIEFDDLLSAGREGLLDAARRFDPAKGIPFRAYANLRIRGSMIDAIRRMCALPRRAYERLAALAAAHRLDEATAEPAFAAPTASAGEAEAALTNQLALAATACALENAVRFVDDEERHGSSEDAGEATPEEQVERAELLAYLEQALKELSQAEAAVIRLVSIEGMSMEAAGRAIKLDKSWVSRLHARALQRLVKRMKNVV